MRLPVSLMTRNCDLFGLSLVLVRLDLHSIKLLHISDMGC